MFVPLQASTTGTISIAGTQNTTSTSSFFTNGFATPAIWFYIIAMIISNAVFFKNMELKKE